MHDIILQYFERKSPEIDLAIDLIIGICLSKQTGSRGLASYVRGDASLDSKERRIERFRERNSVDKDTLLDATKKMLGMKKFVLSLDRTNWKFGKTDINAFAAFGSQDGIGTLVGINMLENKGGNSDSPSRISLAMDVIQRYGKPSIEYIVGDREFFSLEFAAWLDKEEMPYVIRLKENLSSIQRYLVEGSKSGKTLRNIVIGEYDGKELVCDLSIKYLESEYLILASRHVERPLNAYKSRWGIERFFKMLKTGGFNIEDTKIVLMSRLETLFLMASIAYAISVRIGVYIHRNMKRIAVKRKSKCKEYSYFRWGLDWLKHHITVGIQSFMHIVRQIFPALHL